jgi:prepilin-type processing-associated H-X9-DG protein
MKIRAPYRTNRAFTFVDALIVVATLLVLGSLFHSYPRRARVRGCGGYRCTSNLKQVGLAFRGFAQDWDDRYPFQVPNFTNFVGAPAGGSLVSRNTTPADMWMFFQVLSNELSTAKVLMCPQDRSRLAASAEDFSANVSPRGFATATARNNALSYFYGVHAIESNPQMILTGDRNVGFAQKQPAFSSAKAGGLVSVPSTATWSKAGGDLLHTNVGNVCLADGSVQQVNVKQLQGFLQRAEQAHGTNANQFLFPQ